MTHLREILIRWAVENNDDDFFDYLIDYKGSYKSLLFYARSLNLS